MKICTQLVSQRRHNNNNSTLTRHNIILVNIELQLLLSGRYAVIYQYFIVIVILSHYYISGLIVSLFKFNYLTM